eukprot:TRINITY_DN103656_c0_g1_i1.p1 TRINITY_DN103656_c0_g1~~TRINITY_DN103656_c0_g1_i1.p1  ORF type:complete len:306 (+),score=15.08 TRINITY_DN103656_c0_g1_i1:90-1007(+)
MEFLTAKYGRKNAKVILFLLVWPLAMLGFLSFRRKKLVIDPITVGIAYLLYAGVPLLCLQARARSGRRSYLALVLIAVCLALILVPTWTYFMHVLPFRLREEDAKGRVYFDAVMAGLLATCTLSSYASAVFVDPGQPPAVETSTPGSEEMEHCSKCDSIRPPRTHHCSTCRRCVLKMDHHCLFTNNCVGLHNHVHFCMTILSATVYSVFMLHALQPLLEAGVSRWSAVSWTQAIAVVILIMFVPLGSLHTYLVLSNRTTLEFLGDCRRWRQQAPGAWAFPRSLYDAGCWKNIEEAFGRSSAVKAS